MPYFYVDQYARLFNAEGTGVLMNNTLTSEAFQYF